MAKRAAAIGFGNKTTICAKNNSPSPDKYDKPSDFSKSPKKGQTFGVSRESFKVDSIFN